MKACGKDTTGNRVFDRRWGMLGCNPKDRQITYQLSKRSTHKINQMQTITQPKNKIMWQEKDCKKNESSR